MGIHVRTSDTSGKCLCLPLIVAGFQILALRIALPVGADKIQVFRIQFANCCTASYTVAQFEATGQSYDSVVAGILKPEGALGNCRIIECVAF